MAPRRANPEPGRPRAPGSRDRCGYRRGGTLAREHEAWQRRLDAYLETPEGKARDNDLDRRIELAGRLVERAVSRAAKTCERCGEPASARLLASHSDAHLGPKRGPRPSCRRAAGQPRVRGGDAIG